MTRIRVLQTCGAAFLAIAHIICRRIMLEVKGPIGSIMSQKMACFSSCAALLPSIDSLEIRWLSFLGSVDDYILKSENIAEVVFPPSARLFDKIEELACATLFLPRKVEDGLDKFPMIMQQVPFLDWALVHLIAWLNFLISALTHWGSNTTREKEITMDMNCNNNDQDNNNNINNSESTEDQADDPPTTHVPLSEDNNNNNNNVCPANSADSESESTSYTSLVVPSLSMQSMETDLISSPVSSTSGSTVTDNTDTSFLIDSSLPSMTDSVGSGKCSYKEILTKAVKEEAGMEGNNMSAQMLQGSMEKGEAPIEEHREMKKHSIPEDRPVKPMVFEAKGGEISRGKNVKKKKKGKAEKDQILRLFDASWSLS